MEQKLNIAEILKDKPVELKLYSSTFGYIKFNGVHKDKIYFSSEDTNVHSVKQNGKMYDGGECIIFPSKEMRDWSKFSWQKGDALIKTTSEYCVGIFDKWTSNDYSTFSAKYINLGLSDNFSCSHTCKTKEWEKMKNSKNYISEIERVINGKLNLKTLEIEKQLEFKDGDIAFADYGNRQDIFIVSGLTGLSEGYNSFISIDLSSLTLSMGYRTNFFKKDLCKLRLATEEEKQQLFSALAKEGKRWDSEKKQIVDLKPKVELKPFDRCIWKIRNCEGSIWKASFVSYVDEYGATPMDVSIDEDLVNLIILPYNDQTKFLVGTTDEWEGGEQ